VLYEWTINKQTLVSYSFFIPTQNTHTLRVSECEFLCPFEERKLPGKPERQTRRTVKYYHNEFSL